MIAAFLTASLFAAPPPQVCTAQLEGRVVDAATGEAIANAEVTITKGPRTTDRRTSSDDGSFVFEALCPGTLALRASRADYQTRTTTTTVTNTTTNVAMSLEPVNVDVLDDVVVIAPSRLKVETAASTTLSGDALDAARGKTFADAVAAISGVTVLRGPAGGTGKPIIRGQVGRRNLILYDRVRHESQKWGIDHAPEIDPFAADSITVIKGAGGIRYGPDAIGGVVLIDPPPLPTEPGISGETHLVGVSNGRRGTTATRVQGAHRKAPGLGWRLDYNGTRSAALVTPQYPLDNTGSRQWNAGVSLGYAAHGYSLTATYRHHDLQAGIFSGLRTDNLQDFNDGLGLDRPAGTELYSREYAIERAYQRVRHDLAIVRARAPLGRAGTLEATYSHQVNDREEFDVVRDSISGPQLEFDLAVHSAEVVFEHTPLPLGSRADLEGSVGGTYTFRNNRFNGSDPAFLPDYREHAGGAFALERIVGDQVDFEAGLRYDGVARRSLLDDKAFGPARAQDRLADDCEETEEGGRCDTPFHAASGSLGLLVRPRAAPGLVAKLDASTAVRFPNGDEQFIKGSAPSFPVFANGDGGLGVERSWGGGPTIEFTDPWFYVSIAGFGRFIDDYIYFRGVPQQNDDSSAPNFSECAPLQCGTRGPFPLFSPIAIDALFYGGEFDGRLKPPRWPVEFAAQASWVRAQQVPDAQPLVFIPPDRYRASITYHWPDFAGTENGFVGVNATFVDRQRRFDLEADFAPPPPAYGLLGAELGTEVPFAEQRLRVALTGSNLTNARYRDYTSLLRYFANEPGWELALRATLQFELRPPN